MPKRSSKAPAKNPAAVALGRLGGLFAEKLSDTTKWHSHGYGISMAVLREDVNLKIDDFGADKKLNPAVRDYDRGISGYGSVLGLAPNGFGLIHRPGMCRLL